MDSERKSPGPALIRGLTELRDVLRRGERVGLHFKTTTRCRLCGSVLEKSGPHNCTKKEGK